MMAYGKPFRPRDTFSPEQTGKSEPILRLKPNDFDGPIAGWARDRVRLRGETIVPKEVYVDQPPYKPAHRVAWVFHEGRSEVTGEPFAVHHVACDCSGYVEEACSYEERQKIMDECPALMPVIEKHAELVNDYYQISGMLAGLKYDSAIPVKQQGKIIREFVDVSILSLMERDYLFPESWIANVESGWTMPELMAQVLRIRPEDVAAAVDKLVERGDLETLGTNFGLSQQRKDLIDLNTLFAR